MPLTGSTDHHGQRAQYNKGCRCLLCTAANADYRRSGSRVRRQAHEIELLKLRVQVAELKLAAWQQMYPEPPMLAAQVPA